MNDLKKLVNDIMKNGGQYSPATIINQQNQFEDNLIDLSNDSETPINIVSNTQQTRTITPRDESHIVDTQEINEESLSLIDTEVMYIKRALQKYKGKRKLAAKELGISERTLYRKIKEYNLE